MRTTVNVCLVLLVLSLSLHASVASRDEFDQFVRKFSRKYADEAERERRFAVFEDSLRRIAFLNSLASDARYGVGPFADLTPEEFASSRLLPSAPADRTDAPIARAGAALNLPTHFDWKDKGAVTKVRDQGDAGTCWAFSTSQNIEGQWFLHGPKKELVELSPEQLIDCDPYNCGTQGGWPRLSYKYVLQKGGIASEADYPQCAGLEMCNPCMVNKNESFCGPPPMSCDQKCLLDNETIPLTAKISGWKMVDEDDDAIAQYMYANGPLSICMNSATLQYYEGGILDLPDIVCDPTTLNHALLLTGWGEHKDWLGVVTRYWTVKNSWGPEWGEDGYFRVKRKGGKGVCGINTAVTSATL